MDNVLTKCFSCNDLMQEDEMGNHHPDFHKECWETLTGDLTNSNTNEHLGEATLEQCQASYLAGPQGHISISSTGKVIHTGDYNGDDFTLAVYVYFN